MMSDQKTLTQLIESILTDSNFRDNPFFSALNDGSFSKEDFLETQIQFFFAVDFFNQPMSALAAKIPTAELRIEVLRNVWEEHGEGNLEKVHGRTFIELLNRLGDITPEDVDSRALWPEVRSFNTFLAGACVLDEYLTGVGIMGMIERMFAEISSWIGIGIVEREWLSQDRLIHYTLHSELDIKHSQDFFDILAHSWQKSREDKYAIEQGLRLGAYVFNRLYEDLYRARSRRILREIRGNHSRAEG
ncbi:TenA family transcriptional regulator [Legionella sp. CNM-4043-24]|uniref:TenA family transcriptional regulator n=1 Tax=Legionella sp. CNM-4043-24 TaxID=3421646 RepID=UPI00403A9114